LRERNTNVPQKREDVAEESGYIALGNKGGRREEKMDSGGQGGNNGNRWGIGNTGYKKGNRGRKAGGNIP